MSGIKRGLQLLPIFLGCILLSGCSDSNTDQKMNATAEKTDISVSWLGGDIRNEYMLDALSVFAHQHPEICLSMNYTSEDAYSLLYDARNAASMSCDVVQISYAQLTGQDISEQFYPLSDIKDYLNLHLLSSDSVSCGTIDGTLYALSNSIDLPAFYYNEELLQHLGVDAPATWEDLFTLAKLCSGTDLYPLVLTREDLFLLLNAWMEQHTESAIFDENGTLCCTQKQLADLLTFYQTLIEKRIVLIQENPASALCSSLAVGCFGSVSCASLLEATSASSGISLLSGPLLSTEAAPERSGWYGSPGTLYAISSTAKQPREAAKLLRFLISSETIIKKQGLNEGYPSTAGSYQLLSAKKQLQGLALTASLPFIEDKDSFSLIPPKLVSSAIRDCFFDTASQMLEQNGNPSEFSAALYDALNDS